MLVTADCIDPRFNQPYVDIDEQRTRPVPHRYVHGGFTGTDARFSFYFPPTEQYQRRFFQITHQFLTSENTTPGNIGFAVASGAYFVQTNIGGPSGPRRRNRPSSASWIRASAVTGSMRKRRSTLESLRRGSTASTGPLIARRRVRGYN